MASRERNSLLLGGKGDSQFVSVQTAPKLECLHNEWTCFSEGLIARGSLYYVVDFAEKYYFVTNRP